VWKLTLPRVAPGDNALAVEKEVNVARMTDLKEVREGLLEIDIAVHNLWDLGKNMVVGWTTDQDGIEVAFASCYRVLGQAKANDRLLHGARFMDRATFSDVCKLVQARMLRLALPFRIGTAGGEVDPAQIDAIIKRYSIVQTEYRAVMMFEIVDFANASPMEQVGWFVSLDNNISMAMETMRRAGLPVELARSTAGDGALFVWNRRDGLEADLRAYAAFLLVLAENAFARRSAGDAQTAVPRLKAAFTIGSHYSYHQVEANRPRTFEYATGQVTINLARILAKALPGQALVGNFHRPMETGGAPLLDAVLFVARAEKFLARLSGATVDDQSIQEIRSIVTGGSVADHARGVVRYIIEDKHGYRQEAFNLRVKIRPAQTAPVELGLRTTGLAGFDALPLPYALPMADEVAAAEPVAS
jgi:hypothetical protein